AHARRVDGLSSCQPNRQAFFAGLVENLTKTVVVVAALDALLKQYHASVGMHLIRAPAVSARQATRLLGFASLVAHGPEGGEAQSVGGRCHQSRCGYREQESREFPFHHILLVCRSFTIRHIANVAMRSRGSR